MISGVPSLNVLSFKNPSVFGKGERRRAKFLFGFVPIKARDHLHGGNPVRAFRCPETVRVPGFTAGDLSRLDLTGGFSHPLQNAYQHVVDTGFATCVDCRFGSAIDFDCRFGSAIHAVVSYFYGGECPDGGECVVPLSGGASCFPGTLLSLSERLLVGDELVYRRFIERFRYPAGGFFRECTGPKGG